jgi:hypothetical protein
MPRVAFHSLTKRGCYGEESEEEDRKEECEEGKEVEEVTSFFGRAGLSLRSHLRYRDQIKTAGPRARRFDSAHGAGVLSCEPLIVSIRSLARLK